MVEETAEAKITTRGLTGGGTPLREFDGILDSVARDNLGFGGKARGVLNFKDVENVTAIEPYPYPVAQIPVPLSNRKNSTWGILAESFNDLIPDEEDIQDQYGKRMHMKMEVGYIFGQDRATGDDMLGDVWRVTTIEGTEAKASGGKSAADVAKALLDGKNQPDFNREAYQSAAIRADAKFLESIGNGGFITEVLATKEFTKDKDGVFHKA